MASLPDLEAAVQHLHDQTQAALNLVAPKSHSAWHKTGGVDPIRPSDIGAATSTQGAKADAAVQRINGQSPTNGDVTLTLVPPTRQIVTTGPLTGGGALNGDVTLGIATGTGAGTVAAGNDARIVNALSKPTTTPTAEQMLTIKSDGSTSSQAIPVSGVPLGTTGSTAMPGNTAVRVNGTTYTVSGGVIDLGTITGSGGGGTMTSVTDADLAV